MPRGVASLQKSVSISLPQIVGFFPWRPHHRSLKRLPPWMGGLAYFFCCSALIWPESSRRDRKSLNEQKCSERLQSNCKQKNHIRENTFLCWPQYNAQWESCRSISVMSSNYLLWRTKSLQEALQPLVWLISTFRISDWINNSSVCLINALIDSLV